MATSMDTLPAHLLPLVMEEFPQSLATACVCRAGQREPRLRCVQCGIIEEEEEDCSTLEEDQAQRSFLQTHKLCCTQQSLLSAQPNCISTPAISKITPYVSDKTEPGIYFTSDCSSDTNRRHSHES
uniref:Uncharacterized protein n=1 Tax=Sparus aurata TaxID=8175 RepID=A0A671Y4X4_SPAAU